MMECPLCGIELDPVDGGGFSNPLDTDAFREIEQAKLLPTVKTMIKLTVGTDEGMMYPTGYEDCIIGIAVSRGFRPSIALNTEHLRYKLACEFVDTMDDDELPEAGDAYSMAQEYMDYNIVGAYVGETTPVYVYTEGWEEAIDNVEEKKRSRVYGFTSGLSDMVQHRDADVIPVYLLKEDDVYRWGDYEDDIVIIPFAMIAEWGKERFCIYCRRIKQIMKTGEENA